MGEMVSDKPDKRDDMPPVPRDYNEPSYSELMPIKSTQINILKSPLFYFVVVSALISIWLYSARIEILTQDIGLHITLGFVTIGFILGSFLLIVGLYAKTDRSIWSFLITFGVVCAVMFPPTINLFFFVFREVLPGNVQATDAISNFVGMFFGAGLMEELIKVLPVLAGAYITINAAQWQPRLNDKLFQLLQIRGPLDGLLMGLTGGAAFIFIETGVQYYPDAVRGLIQQTGDAGAGLASGLLLLLPRTFSGLVGHMAWAGITGYFIGLAVLRPATGLKVIGLAWAGTSALHALWNSTGYIPAANYVSALASGTFLIACLLKARQLAAARGFARESFGSIVVDPAQQAQQQPNQASTPPPANPPPPANTSSQATAGQASAEDVAQADAAQAPPQMRLLFEGATIPIAEGPIDLSDIGNTAVSAEVTRHPTRPDVLGLKNCGQHPWTATLRDGSSQEIGPGRNIRLADGVKIDFGGDVIAEVLG